MTSAQISAFQANSSIAPAAMATVIVGLVFAVLLLWGAWAIRTAYVGWAENQLNQRQVLGVVGLVEGEQLGGHHVDEG